MNPKEIGKKDGEIIREAMWEKKLNKFIENWCGKNIAYLLDTDDNDGEELREIIRQEISQAKKEYNDICPKCRGKGYSTEFRGYTISPDFIGDVRYNSPIKIEINYCDCQRGNQIKKLISQAEQRGKREGLEELQKEYEKYDWGVYDPFTILNKAINQLK